MAAPLESAPDPRRQLSTQRDRLRRIPRHPETEPEVRILIERIDDALERLERGTYGICEACLAAIEPALLEIDPLARFCIEDLAQEERRRLEHDIALASNLQKSLLPPREVAAGPWRVHTRCVPAGPVGGDYADILVRDANDGGRLAFFVGDASGKGIAASLLMAQMSALVRLLAEFDTPPRDVLAQVNRVLCQNVPSPHYATLLGGAAAKDGTIEFASAGHCAPVLLRGGRAEILPVSGLPAGLFPAATYDTAGVSLGRGDVFVAHTDGVTEAHSPEGEEYGPLRLIQSIERHAPSGPQAIADGVLADLRAFCAPEAPTDDVTVMVVTHA